MLWNFKSVFLDLNAVFTLILCLDYLVLGGNCMYMYMHGKLNHLFAGISQSTQRANTSLQSYMYMIVWRAYAAKMALKWMVVRIKKLFLYMYTYMTACHMANEQSLRWCIHLHAYTYNTYTYTYDVMFIYTNMYMYLQCTWMRYACKHIEAVIVVCNATHKQPVYHNITKL